MSELADELTALRKKLDATMGDLDTVRAVAAAKVSALHGQLKQVSAGMSALEVAISSATSARGASPAVNRAAEPARHAEAESCHAEAEAESAGHAETEPAEAESAEPARHAETEPAEAESAEPARHAKSTEAAEAGGQLHSENPSEHQPTDDGARKEPTTAADVAAAMLADLSLESPTSHAVAEEPLAARPSEGQPEADVLVSYQPAQSAQAKISSSDMAILEQEFGDYLELAAVQSPAPEPANRRGDAEKSVTDAWA
jgi:uncharacterized phage infection (PIP) family protein YhgE